MLQQTFKNSVLLVFKRITIQPYNIKTTLTSTVWGIVSHRKKVERGGPLKKTWNVIGQTFRLSYSKRRPSSSFLFFPPAIRSSCDLQKMLQVGAFHICLREFWISAIRLPKNECCFLFLTLHPHYLYWCADPYAASPHRPPGPTRSISPWLHWLQ